MPFKWFVDDITINLWFFRDYASMTDIKRRCNPMVDLSKSTFNKKNIEQGCSLKLQLIL